MQEGLVTFNGLMGVNEDHIIKYRYTYIKGTGIILCFSMHATWKECMDESSCDYAVNKTATAYTVSSHLEITEVYDFVCEAQGAGELGEGGGVI